MISPQKSYVICTIARSGSTLLSDGLEVTGIAGRPREFFSEPFVEVYERNWTGKLDAPDYFSRVRQAATTPNGVYGVKVLRHMFPFMIQCAREHAPNGPDAPAELLSSLLPELKYIWTRRRNVVERAVSQVMAQKTGVWREYKDGPKGKPRKDTGDRSEPLFDFDGIHNAVRRGYEWDREWAKYFEESGIEPLTLYYEDFAERYRETLRETLEFLGIEANVEIAEPRLKKQANDRSAEWIERFQQMARERGIDIDNPIGPGDLPMPADGASWASSPQADAPESIAEPEARPARRRAVRAKLDNPPSYLVCTANRSGSTLLCDGLRRTHVAGNPVEYFAVKFADQHEKRFKERGIVGPTYFSRALQMGTTPNGVFGAKVQQMQFQHLIKYVGEEYPDTGLAPLPLLRHALPNLHFVWLWRRDSLARAISAVRAAASGVWHQIENGEAENRERRGPAKEPEFNFQRIFRAAREHNRFDREWVQFFQENSIQPYEVVYEDFADNYEQTLRNVLSFLGLPTDVPIEAPRLNKLADATTQEWTERFSDIAKKQGIDIYAGSLPWAPAAKKATGSAFASAATETAASTQSASVLPFGRSRPTSAFQPVQLEAPFHGGQVMSNTAADLMREAGGFHQQGKLADAERVYRKILDEDAEHPEALHALGVIRLQGGKAEEAADLIQRSLAKQPNVPAAYNHLAIALVSLRRYELALANFTRALMLKPDYAEAHNNMGAALKTVGRNEEALVHFGRALTLKQDYIDAVYNYALMLQLFNRHAESQQQLDKVLKARPDHADAHFYMGIALTAQNKRTEAIDHFQKSMALKPDPRATEKVAGNA